jgi:hypothetical protein
MSKEKNAFYLNYIFVTNITFILQDAANDKFKVSRYGMTLFFSPILPHTYTHTSYMAKGNLFQ